MDSPFLAIPEADWVCQNALAFAFRDRFPVSEGHSLIVPRRVIATWFEATREEQCAIFDLIAQVKHELDASLHPDGYNVGFNSGGAAGQTVEHLHVHVIPRYTGDVSDPTGGVRHVIPDKGNYRRQRADPLSTGGVDDPLLRQLRPLLRRSREVAIVAAFVQDSGLRILEQDLITALSSGARIRLVTGDYLNITQERALRRLLDWELRTIAYGTAPDVDGLGTEEETEAPLSGSLEIRIIETASLPHPTRAFHPKSWRFEGDGFSTAFVGSSNISHSALCTGIEWNARIDRWVDSPAYEKTCEAFEELWGRARRLDREWLAGYHESVRAAAHPLPPGEEDGEDPAAPPTPNALQERALEAIAGSREEGSRRALVVMATGLGKTWFAAFDCRAFAEERGISPRILFLAHRRELLTQAANTFRTAFPDESIGFFAGAESDLDADIVFASVQKLTRPDHLAAVPPGHFHYVIIDEVHHAAATSYRRILAHIEPGFLLGLTATPDRADEEDVLGLFDGNLPFRADLGEGIEHDLLIPFRYLGLKDTVDYAPIPWRNRRFDPSVLEAKVQTQERMETLWRAWEEHAGKRTLVFCSSIPHAEFAKRWLTEKGVRVRSVHTGPESDDRDDCLTALAKSELDAVCSVDLFNEGIDVPSIDRVVMLRPTESPIVFLQQLGRGLRVHPEVEFLQVIDFVGNHRVFLDRVRRLLSLTAKPAGLREFLSGHSDPELPAGCSVEIELEAKEMLERLLPHRGASAAVEAYRNLRLLHARRPLAGELYRRGYNPRIAGGAQVGWFEFVRAEGDLDDQERAALDAADHWLRDLETTSMTKVFKMVVLEILAEAEALTEGMDLGKLARRSHARLVRSPELFREISEVQALDDPSAPDPAQWLAYWRQNPVAAWARSRWFDVEGNRLVSRIPRAAGDPDGRTLTNLTLELVDWRLARHFRDRTEEDSGVPSFLVKVTWNQRDPILLLGGEANREQLPHGETDVFLPDGSSWRFRFAKIAVNVAHPVGDNRNRLPDLLRRWFGPAAGHPGTDQRVRFQRSPDGWWIEPLSVRQRDDIPFGRLLAYPSLNVAAGSVAEAASAATDATEVVLPGASPELVAVRASGISMEGEPDFIRDGDWLLVRWSRGEPLGIVENRPAIFQRRLDTGEPVFHLKRLRRAGNSYDLTSDNPESSSLAPDASTVLVGIVEHVVKPEDLAPEPGAQFSLGEIARAFHLSTPPSPGVCRVDGHLFLLVDGIQHLPAPDRCDLAVEGRRPAETAFVFVQAPAQKAWRYAGVGRQDDGLWAFPVLDFAAWRELGGRGVSRSLLPQRLEDAARLTRQIHDVVPPREVLTLQSHRYRVLDRTSQGGLRIDGGPGGFKERTVSTQDFAWVLEARVRADASGALLDESFVNRIRYLPGTPRGSTRWIDTGHALRLSECVTKPE